MKGNGVGTWHVRAAYNVHRAIVDPKQQLRFA